MFICEMTQDECREVLGRSRLGRLACARDDQPYVVPVYFAYEADYVYLFSTPGQKIDWMRSNPMVCLETDERESDDRWSSVIVSGLYEELRDTADLAAERALAERALAERAKWWSYARIPAAEWRRKSTRFEPIFYRIRIVRMSGHRATPSSSA